MSPESPAPRADRLPAQTHLGGVVLQVSDLARSLAFYRDVIGLVPLRETADTVALGVPAVPSPLVTLRAIAGTHPVRRRGAYGLFHFAILLPDRASLGRFAAHLSSMGIVFGMSDHRVSEALYLSDPDGLGIEVYADRARASWQYVDQQLVMTTDPLDADDLIAAAGGVPWSGMPPGTTMGHVHLHVGDLRAAAAFYQDRLGFDITVWNYPGALFFSAGGYHHHLGTNVWAPGPAPDVHQARLLEWTLIVPSISDAQSIAGRLHSGDVRSSTEGGDWTVSDPWSTTVRIIASRSASS